MTKIVMSSKRTDDVDRVRQEIAHSACQTRRWAVGLVYVMERIPRTCPLISRVTESGNSEGRESREQTITLTHQRLGLFIAPPSHSSQYFLLPAPLFTAGRPLCRLRC